MIRILQGLLTHLLDKLLIGSKYIPEQQQEEKKENDKRYDRPDGNIIDGL
jgi:hypothetical protein